MTTQTFSESLITHTDIASFAADHVNLKREDAAEYRAQVHRLREKLQGYVAEHPNFGLLKLLLNGSLAKGLALKTLNDIDVALYVDAAKAKEHEDDLPKWIAEKLRLSFPQMSPDQITPTTHCVQITFKNTGLTVDVAPVYALGDDEDHGYLVNKDTGERVLTSIPRHLRFTRTRKGRQPDHYAQVVRLMKWWARLRKLESDDQFRMKSFMIELLVAHLADGGQDLSDYPTALQAVFTYIVRSRLNDHIAFEDYYPLSKFPAATGAAIEIFDPVNVQNNVAGDYTESNRRMILASAEDALDAIAEARYATTKARAVSCWQRVLGPSFRG